MVMNVEKFSNLKGCKIFEKQAGSFIGYISDMSINSRKKSIDHLILGINGAVSKDINLPFKALTKYGDNVLYIEETEIVKKYKNRKRKLIGTISRMLEDVKVKEKDGSELGIVSDVFIDINNGRLEGVELSEGLSQDLLFGRKLLPLIGKVEIGENDIVVGRDCVEEMMLGNKGLKKLLRGGD